MPLKAHLKYVFKIFVYPTYYDDCTKFCKYPYIL